MPRVPNNARRANLTREEITKLTTNEAWVRYGGYPRPDPTIVAHRKRASNIRNGKLKRLKIEQRRWYSDYNVMKNAPARYAVGSYSLQIPIRCNIIIDTPNKVTMQHA